MKNIALILGSSVYNNADDLPGCKNDIKYMKELLESTGKYDVLVIDELENKNDVLEKVNRFLEELADDDINEVFLYYTGHGYSKEKFYFVLKDTINSKINSTAISNDEIDDIVRKVQPKLFVKVIDACESEISYIKNLQSKEIISKEFENCRFMFSSKRNQSSYASKNMSFFTREFINAVARATITPIKYRDIENQISDAFSINRLEQTPMFSNQTDGQEVFCEKNDSLEAFLLVWNQYCTGQNDINIDESIEGKIKRYMERCREKGEVDTIVKKIIDEFMEKNIQTSWLSKFYDVEVKELTTENSDRYTDNKSLGEWLQKNKNSLKLFVDIKTTKVEVNENPYALLTTYFSGKQYKDVITGYRTRVDEIPSGILFSCVPKNKTLPKYEVVILMVYGATCFCTMSNIECYIREAWNGYTKFSSDGFKTKVIEYEETNDEMIQKYVDEQINRLMEFAEKSLVEYIDE